MSEGKKYDQGKLRFDLIDPFFTKEVVEVLTVGADKYGDNNWQEVPAAQERYYAALQRHLHAWRCGEELDKEDALTHLAHAATNIMFLMHFDRLKTSEV